MSITIVADWNTGLDKFSAEQLQCFVPKNRGFAPEDVILIIGRFDHYVEGKCNIFVQVEPEAIVLQQQRLIENSQRYERIYTYNAEVLKSCSNAVFYVYGTTWIPSEIYLFVSVDKKQWKASNLAGSKSFPRAKGHIFRQQIHLNQERLADSSPMPITFFRSAVQKPVLKEFGAKGNNPFLKAKIDLFDEFQFSIIVENSRQENYFTEKLIDCIITKTIPIYYGCPNISDFFDTKGWIIIETESVEEIATKLNYITLQHYQKYLASVAKNYETALSYVDFGSNLLKAASLANK